ncbi:Transcriptional regulator containing PAS, AAA-type ATPase, and DNA-binding Fis domains [Tindallia magadiensis]|uniref:Transcriptional regulator containing PAS, AAA-type ATPase, and DNA-binding Fis domains n=1 Tax=Tindallia magadiensis TaxID=69895 RepID=A0A1I3BY80_9FIRM|nr:sigma 54-interacting transcriptional regulator [Tindallia magadiensis]SFH67318.1 Transcriptional regulator containing PAS, AAA-type ATPase, and DNA-binding Fis domains [Tindallia magadiensis]
MKIVLLAGTDQTKARLHQQMEEMFQGLFHILSYAIDTGLPETIAADLVVFSSKQVADEISEKNLLSAGQRKVTAVRTIPMDYLDQVMKLAKGERILLVNDRLETALESIEALRRIGVDHIEMIPWAPTETLPLPLPKVAITPGEGYLVPAEINTVVDIGPRVFDFSTIAAILYQTGYYQNCSKAFSEGYLKKIIHMASKLADSHREIETLNQHLSEVIDGLNDGLMVFNQEGWVSVLNEKARQLLKVPDRGKSPIALTRLLSSAELKHFLLHEEVQEKILMLFQQEILVKKLVDPKSLTTAVILKNVQETIASGNQIKRDLMRRGFFARYTFDDLIGNSEALEKVKKTSRKLAASDLTVLLVGESGTGKEMIASSIHRASPRWEGPFLAVNFSALSDELIESELFGYEEGAFTGARKGGKMGLFEQADGGTIFLDEIGDISGKVQSRLLRVLQEKEIMPVGGHEIRSINVRIVAATNQNLEALVSRGIFREDLYYRLKNGFIHLPPLRQRKEDILPLAAHFISMETKRSLLLEREVKQAMENYHWPGNIRELQNLVSYMLAVAEGDYLTLEHFPDSHFFSQGFSSSLNQKKPPVFLTPAEEKVLCLMATCHRKGEKTGRESLCRRLRELEEREGRDAHSLQPRWTFHQVRVVLGGLVEKGLIQAGTGRQGSRLTEKGIRYIEEQKYNGC